MRFGELATANDDVSLEVDQGGSRRGGRADLHRHVGLRELDQHGAVAPHIQRHGLGLRRRLGRVGFRRGSAVDLGSNLELAGLHPLGLDRARQDSGLTDIIKDDMDILEQLGALGTLEPGRSTSRRNRVSLRPELDEHSSVGPSLGGHSSVAVDNQHFGFATDLQLVVVVIDIGERADHQVVGPYVLGFRGRHES